MAVKPSDLDVASKLLKPSFRGVAFQCSSWGFAFDHQHAPHLYPDRDAGYIESTGRNPARYQFTALFRLGIAGQDVDLFPTQWRLFVAACLDRTTGPLVHPELGKIKVKCVSCRTSFDPQRRDGVDVEVEFVETSDKESELTDLVKGASPMGIAITAARKLDDAVGNASPKPEYPESLAPSALDTLKALEGALSQFRLGVGNLTGSIDQILGALSEFRETAEDTTDPKSYAILDAIDRLFNATALVGIEATSTARPITPARTAATTTLDAAAAFFSMSLDEFIKLNPRLAERTMVNAGTDVFVYADAA